MHRCCHLQEFTEGVEYGCQTVMRGVTPLAQQLLADACEGTDPPLAIPLPHTRQVVVMQRNGESAGQRANDARKGAAACRDESCKCTKFASCGCRSRCCLGCCALVPCMRRPSSGVRPGC